MNFFLAVALFAGAALASSAPGSSNGQPCSCSQNGNTYKPVDGCKAFTQETARLPPTRLSCPAGLLFNTNVCVCDWPRNVKCNSNCDSSQPQPSPGCTKSCSQNGNTYRPLPGCQRFTQSVADVVKGTHDCPGGLLFDTNVCVCNYANKVQCPC